MWYGGEVQTLSKWAMLRTDRHTLKAFRARVFYTLNGPSHVHSLRWTAMRKWYAKRLAEGSDLDQEVFLEDWEIPLDE